MYLNKFRKPIKPPRSKKKNKNNKKINTQHAAPKIVTFCSGNR